MSFVSIPASVPGRLGRDQPYVGNKFPSREELSASPFPAIRTSMGFLTNDHSPYSYTLKQFAEKAWYKTFLPGVYVFHIRDSEATKDLVDLRGRGGGALANSRRTTLATLPMVNWVLASKHAFFGDDVQKVFDTIVPLGLNTTSDDENTPSFTATNVVVNVIVQGDFENGLDIWKSEGNMGQAHFVLKRVQLKKGERLAYSLERQRVASNVMEGPCEFFQIVPVSTMHGSPPAVEGNTHYCWTVGRINGPRQLRDIYANHKNNSPGASTTDAVGVATDVPLECRSFDAMMMNSKAIQIFLH